MSMHLPKKQIYVVVAVAFVFFGGIGCIFFGKINNSDTMVKDENEKMVIEKISVVNGYSLLIERDKYSKSFEAGGSGHSYYVSREAPNGDKKLLYSQKVLLEDEPEVPKIVLSADKHYFASMGWWGHGAQSVVIYDVETGEELDTQQLNIVSFFAWSPYEPMAVVLAGKQEDAMRSEFSQGGIYLLRIQKNNKGENEVTTIIATSTEYTQEAIKEYKNVVFLDAHTLSFDREDTSANATTGLTSSIQMSGTYSLKEVASQTTHAETTIFIDPLFGLQFSIPKGYVVRQTKAPSPDEYSPKECLKGGIAYTQLICSKVTYELCNTSTSDCFLFGAILGDKYDPLDTEGDFTWYSQHSHPNLQACVKEIGCDVYKNESSAVVEEIFEPYGYGYDTLNKGRLYILPAPTGYGVGNFVLSDHADYYTNNHHESAPTIIRAIVNSVRYKQ